MQLLAPPAPSQLVGRATPRGQIAEQGLSLKSAGPRRRDRQIPSERNSHSRRMIDDLQKTPYSLPMAASVIECDTPSLVFSGHLVVRGCKSGRCRFCRSVTDTPPESQELKLSGSINREPVRRSKCESRGDIAYEGRRTPQAAVSFGLAMDGQAQMADSASLIPTILRAHATRPGLRCGLLDVRRAHNHSLLGTRSLP